MPSRIVDFFGINGSNFSGVRKITKKIKDGQSV